MDTSSEIGVDEMASRVYAMIRGYVRHRTETRCGISFKQYQKSGYKNPEYARANNKVCMDAFLAMRSRKDQANFLNYFTGTICAVPQFLPEDKYRQLAAALLNPNRWEDLKSLSLLALSAMSQSIDEDQEQGGGK